MLLKFSLIIFLITIQLFAEVPLTIYAQLKDNEQYQKCKAIKDLDQQIKCTKAIEKPFIEKGIDQFIQSFEPKYQSSVQNNISHLDQDGQAKLLDLYANIFPSLDRSHTQIELMKIKYNLIFYVIGLNDLTGACVSSANKIFQSAPELKNGTFKIVEKIVNIHAYIMEEAVFIDDIANLSVKNGRDYFDKLEIFLNNKDQYIIDTLQGEPDDWAFMWLYRAKLDRYNAIDAAKKGNWKLAKAYLKGVYFITYIQLDHAIESQKLINYLNGRLKR
jgi:hypothetical protein